MVRYDFTQRYASVRQVREALEHLPIVLNSVVVTAQMGDSPTAAFEQEDTAIFEQEGTAVFDQGGTAMLPEDLQRSASTDVTQTENTTLLPENRTH